MTSGRCVWGFFGNISTESAINTVTEVRSLLNLNLTKREELHDFRVVALPIGQQRIDFEV